MLYLEHYGATDAGKVRANNEDALLVGSGEDATLFAVADGIGGFEAGEVASSIAVEVLKRVQPGDSLEDAIREANRRIVVAARGDERMQGMGTTVVAVRFGGSEEEPFAEVSHVGDSRAYLMRDGELRAVTEDHSLVAELVRSGDLTRAQASEHPQKNLITRALGADAEVEVDTTTVSVRPDDRLLLSSDGLTDMVPEAKVRGILLNAADESPEVVARTLIAAALDAGGADNVTAVVIDVREEVERRSGTQEMRPVRRSEPPAARATVEVPTRHRRGRHEEGQEGDPRTSASRATHGERRGESRAKRTQARRKGGFLRTVAAAVRGLAALAVVGLLLTPFYLWGSSRYFMGFDEGEVVVYQGLPYAPFGFELNGEDRRTGLRERDLRESYREQIEAHRLYDREGVEQVVNGLEDSRGGR